MSRPIEIGCGALGLLALGYVVAQYLRGAGLFYNPPWGDPLFYLAFLVGLVLVVTAVLAAVKGRKAAACVLIAIGTLTMVACGSAAWFDHRFESECANRSLNSYAPGCPDE